MKRTIQILLKFLLFYSPVLYAQSPPNARPLSLQEAFQLALKNSFQLKVIEKNVQMARQQTIIARSDKLPDVVSDLNYGYISNADIWNPSFSQHQTGPIPHHFTDFSALATQVVFKGDAVNNSIRKSLLQEQVASLTQENNEEDVKLLVAAKYLDIYRLLAQRKVYLSNISLTYQRLKNVLAMQRQGMVTNNDVLRTQLTISDYQLYLRAINNDIIIQNQQLNIVTGLSDSVRLVPDSTLLTQAANNDSLTTFINEAYQENHELKIARLNNTIAETDIRLAKSERVPQVNLYAGSALQRPFIYSIPALDIYYNVWQAGITVHYNLSSIYQTGKRVRSEEIRLEQYNEEAILKKQNVEVDVRSAYIKYRQSMDDLVTLENDLKSSEENYRIVEKKYFNQLDLLADMIDAANTKIESEIKVVTARINVVYTRCRLLRTIGTL